MSVGSEQPRAKAVRSAAALIGLGLVGVLVAAVAAMPTRSPAVDAAAVPATSTPPAVPAAVTVSPAAQAIAVDPLGPVRATAEHGTLTTVTLVDDTGDAVPGSMSPDHRSWHSTAPLGYGRTHTLTVASRGVTGVAATQTSTFTTVHPRRQTRVTFAATSGAELVDGGTYGVGTVIVATFDEAVADRRAAERRLSVTTDPPVEGSWYWVDDHHAHWRPREYYQPGTRITADADVYGIDLGDGTYGERDSRVSFRIGDSHVSIADDATKQINVYDNGELVRTIPTSMGMGGTEIFGGTTISFWTQPGIYTVMDKSEVVVMDSSTYGLPVDSPSGYKETVNYAVRLTSSGIYVHQLDSTVWAQGNTNVSHGCLNVNGDHARWFYEFSRPGDVFEVRNTGGDPLPLWQNGDWGVPWEEWLTGSALR